MVLERFVQRGNALGAFLVLLSTLLGPIAYFYWGNIIFWSDHQLVFVWGFYSLSSQRIMPHDSRWSRIDPPEISLLVTLWLVCGVVLAATMLYSSLEKHNPFIVWIVLVFVLILQIALPFIILPITDFDVRPYPQEWTDVFASYPIPAILAMVAQSVLYRVRSKRKIDKISN
ncbi:MAG: hypothetical protein ACW960_10060 [Candidatus Thorarchaeota archaeon]